MDAEPSRLDILVGRADLKPRAWWRVNDDGTVTAFVRNETTGEVRSYLTAMIDGEIRTFKKDYGKLEAGEADGKS